MIAGVELAAWMVDPARQKLSTDAADAFARRWAERPLIADLRRELDSMPVKTAALARDAALRFMDRSAEIQALIDELVAAMAADPYFQPPFTPASSEIHTGIALIEDPTLSIAIGISGVDALAAKKSVKRGPVSINFTGLLTIFRFVKAGGATLSFWEAPEIKPSFVSESSGRCRLVERRKIEDGETIVMDGRFQSFVIEHATSDLAYLHAIVRAEGAPLAVEYDSRTLEFVGAASTDEQSSRVQMMVTLLRLMDRTDAVPLIERLLDSPHFYARWHLMRELLAIDAEAALPSLRAMAVGDPHDEVRAAAQQTLEMFFPDEAGSEAARCRA